MKNKIIDDIEFIHGQHLTCKIMGREVSDARIKITKNNIFICQNIMDGKHDEIPDEFGYVYIWSINRGLDSSSITELNLINKFKKGDYLVCLRPLEHMQKYIKTGYVYKQYKDTVSLYVEKNSYESSRTSTNAVLFKNDYWRYATKDEIHAYENIGGPYCINSSLLNKKFIPYSWYKNRDGSLVCYLENNLGYGFNDIGNWFFNSGWSFKYNIEKWSLASITEVQEALLRYVKQEYKVGDIHTGIHASGDGKNRKLHTTVNEYEFCDNTIRVKNIHKKNCAIRIDGCSGLIFERGIWSKVISDSVLTSDSLTITTSKNVGLYKCPTSKLEIVNEISVYKNNLDITPVKTRVKTKKINKRIIPKL